MALAQRAPGGRQLGVADAAWAVGLGRGLERTHDGHLSAERDLDVVAAGELEHGQRVLGDEARLDVARDARHRDDLGLR